jgi:hypothetical protein
MSETVGTHPVYIGKGLKKEVKMQATEHELTMREVTERLIERGISEGYHDTPLPSEFVSEIEDIAEDVDTADDERDLDDAVEDLDTIEGRLDAIVFPEPNAHDELAEQIQDVRDTIRTVRPKFSHSEGE